MDEEAVGEQEDQQQGGGAQHGGCHHRRVIDVGVVFHKGRERQRHGEHLWAGEQHQRQGIVVPAPDEHQHAQRRQLRTGGRDDHMLDLLQGVCAVNLGSVEQVLRDLQTCLAHQESAVGGGQVGDNQRPVGVVDIEPVRQHEARHEQHLFGDDHGGEVDDEQRAAPGKAQAGKGIACQGRSDERTDDAGDGDDG